MKAFQFNLEKLLKYRAEILKQAERALLAKTNRCNQLIREREELLAEERACMEKYTRLEDMRAAAFYRSKLRNDADKKREELQKRENERIALRDEYTRRLKEKKILDNLREQALSRYKLETRRAEEKKMDDIIAASLRLERF